MSAVSDEISPYTPASLLFTVALPLLFCTRYDTGPIPPREFESPLVSPPPLHPFLIVPPPLLSSHLPSFLHRSIRIESNRVASIMLNRACAPASLARKRLDLFMKRTKRSSMDGVEKRLNCKVSAREINEQLKGGGEVRRGESEGHHSSEGLWKHTPLPWRLVMINSRSRESAHARVTLFPDKTDLFALREYFNRKKKKEKKNSAT